jgi:hypothetical protein
MLVESYGGKYPVCSFDRIMMRYGSTGWFMFDACPRCGFAYASNQQGDNIEDPEEVWKTILKNEKPFLKDRNLPVSIDGILQWMMQLPKPSEDRDTVFVYTEKDVEEYKKSNLYKERKRLFDREVVVFI